MCVPGTLCTQCIFSRQWVLRPECQEAKKKDGKDKKLGLMGNHDLLQTGDRHSAARSVQKKTGHKKHADEKQLVLSRIKNVQTQFLTWSGVGCCRCGLGLVFSNPHSLARDTTRLVFLQPLFPGSEGSKRPFERMLAGLAGLAD